MQRPCRELRHGMFDGLPGDFLGNRRGVRFNVRFSRRGPLSDCHNTTARSAQSGYQVFVSCIKGISDDEVLLNGFCD
jgi:hypothetical protein